MGQRDPFSAADGDLALNPTMLVARPYRPFKSSEEYLYAMREDLAEWLHHLYGLDISADNFFEVLETGEELCKHANNVYHKAEDQRRRSQLTGRKSSARWEVPNYEVTFRPDVPAGSFYARDNVHNFIRWSRDLGVHQVLLFETDDLVLRKNEKHVILALLEVARRGARFGIDVPILVQMEDDIDREMEADRRAEERRAGNEDDSAPEGDVAPPTLFYGPNPQIITNDLKSLDEMVRELVERCACPSQFPMVKVSEGKYRIGDTKVLIFVRILRSHVMVRVGGGWDTLHHFLDKHDPCRCRSGHRTAISSRVGIRSLAGGADRQLTSLIYERSDDAAPMSPSPIRRVSGHARRDSTDSRSSFRLRSESPAPNRDSTLNSVPSNKSPEPSGSCDSSSEVSDEGYKSQGPPPQVTPRSKKSSSKITFFSTETVDIPERPESSLTLRSSEGSSVSTDDLGAPLTPPKSPSASGDLLDPSLTWTTAASEPVLNPKPKSRIPFLESLNNRFMGNKRTRKTLSSLRDASQPAWNAGPGLRGDSRARKNSAGSIDLPFNNSISRSQSTTSEQGLQSLSRDSFGRTSRLSSKVMSLETTGKNTWSGKGLRERASLAGDTFKPPSLVRNIRSASASPATSRKHFSSASSTPIIRSPKRSAPASTITSPVHTIAESFSTTLEESQEPSLDVLAHLEDIVNSYRAKVVDKYTSEGKQLPPELTEELSSAKKTSLPPTPARSTVKIAPRKASMGSRIPAPTYFISR